ncbi:uncharacterized protein EI97DRAFT_493056 [Westerdykella ornata]|uniref:FHF complex subunit HOOK-interacting protein C-terminal domain-containing protein n=1 Tax=Westerdykella ornata TaxID=318751 RepID=A0A6A6JMC1_WESOR|nr:uncharacterized protein EI97DRAFT_493056 [Westerdykella ornata]KAF2277810.1 hypothetical protein EI97DRAFT_493056 [Westerdykella ornata]
MDFWIRLLGGSSTKKAVSSDPQQRLARFRQRYNQILQTWQKTQTLSNDREAVSVIRRGFQALAAILNDEARSPAPHLCLSFAAAQQIYTAVSKIAATSHDEGMVRDAVNVYSALIDSEEEDFLENDVFAASLMSFVGRTIGSGSIGVGEDIEADIVELLFGIAAKIRLQPEILPIWFTTAATDTNGKFLNQKTDFAGVTQKEDFPLCYQLIDHVHHEGRIGDFARTGLLYIFETASKSMTLEQWIVNSDLPTLMATGLGALYSQLSRKLSTLHLGKGDELPLILRLSDYAEMLPNTRAENFFSDDFQSHLETFLSYLRFWQDVLIHCTSADVRLSLIDHFQILFLQQLLYPSLLESSDVDGGSSVAVLTYLRRILDILDHPELVHMILNYLLALPETDAATPHTPRSPAAIKRRQSLMMLNTAEKEDDRMNPSLFNLVDLVLSSTDSRDPQTVLAALKLATVILGKHHSYGVGSLVKTMHVHQKEPHRTIGALNEELEVYMNLAIELAGETGVDEAYDSHLKDKLSMLESHPCSLKALTPPTMPGQGLGYFDLDSGTRNVEPHYLIPEDPLFKSLQDLLLRFLTNDVEINLALTEAIVTLGTCSQLRLEGWLSVDPTSYHFPNADVDAGQSAAGDLVELEKASRRPDWDSSAIPPLLACLQSLQAQVEALRGDIQGWDELVAGRKHVFRTYDELNDMAKSSASQVGAPRPTDSPAGSWTPQIPKHVLESSASAPAGSPRGRKEGMAARSTSSVSSAPVKGGQNSAGSSSRAMSPLPAAHQVHPRTNLMTDVLGNLADVNNNPNLKRRIRFRRPARSQTVEVMLSKYQPPPKEPADDATADGEDVDMDDIREASVGHIITNVVILQEFVLELVALMQVRASLFHEVRFA